MKISGFTFIKNATKLYIPIKESILSILPIVDEFWVALGKGDDDDHTRKEIESINSDKINIIDTIWNTDLFPKNTEFAHQTDIAKEKCSGDWLFYLQGDEVVHEKYLDGIVEHCKKYLKDIEVEGILFSYKHFWGDYNHYHNAHGWYPKEIRIIRNNPDIHSWKDAQSFRKFDEFGYSFEDYMNKHSSNKLKVARAEAFIYHYGWVRPPEMMTKKNKSNSSSYRGKDKTEARFKNQPHIFDYGPLHKLPTFKETHPFVMKNWINKFNWGHHLQYEGTRNKSRPLFKHEKLKYRFLTFLEQKLFNGMQLGGFKNYKIIRK